MSAQPEFHTNGSPLPEEIRHVLEPDFNSSTFQFGKNKDGSSRTWKLQPMLWRYEKHFRKQVMPMLAVTYRPFEIILQSFNKSNLVEAEPPHVLNSLFSAETEVDDYLVKSLYVILKSQDNDITEDWVDESAESRNQMLDIINKQCEIHKIMDRLGESLAERFEKLAQMMGIQIDSASLKQLWKQVSGQLSALITNGISTAGNATGRYTENLLETMSQTSKTINMDDIITEDTKVHLVG